MPTADLDHLTPKQQAVFRKAVKHYREHYGFTMDLFIEVAGCELDCEEIAKAAMSENMAETLRSGRVTRKQ